MNLKLATALVITVGCFARPASIAAQAAQAPQTSQAPQTPPPLWTGSVGAGLALTSGNTETKNINLSMDLVRDPKKRTVTRINGLYLRGDKDGELTVNRGTLTGREEFNLTDRAFLFGQIEYLRDTFKQIDYFIAPTVGFGYKIIKTDKTELILDNGIGAIWEKDTGRDTAVTGGYVAGERFMRKISPNAILTQSIASSWKTNDWGDSLHTFVVGLTASLTTRTQLKVELRDNLKNHPPPTVAKKNDTAFITALVLKF